MISQKRDELDGATVLGKGRLEELAAITGGTGAVGSMAIQRKSKAASALKTPARGNRTPGRWSPIRRRRRGRHS